MKKIKILLIIISILFSIFLAFVLIVDKTRLIKKHIFNAKPVTTYPFIGNSDIKLKVKNKNRFVYGLLSKKGKKLIVIFHGNASTINSISYLGKIFYDNGYSILLIEYPGYGLAYQYDCNENNIYKDSEFLIKYTQSNYGFSINNTFIIGKSLGSGVAVEMTKRKLCNKTLLITPFTSIPSVGHYKIFPIIPYFVILDRFSNITKAKNINNKILLVHGTSDRLVPYKMSEKLLKNFKNAELLTIKNADHWNIIKMINNNQWNTILNYF